jgi:hypothetical protein
VALCILYATIDEREEGDGRLSAPLVRAGERLRMSVGWEK